jgi:hypothetical protein
MLCPGTGPGLILNTCLGVVFNLRQMHASEGENPGETNPAWAVPVTDGKNRSLFGNSGKAIG